MWVRCRSWPYCVLDLYRGVSFYYLIPLTIHFTIAGCRIWKSPTVIVDWCLSLLTSIFALEILKLCLKVMKTSNYYFFMFCWPFYLHKMVSIVWDMSSQYCFVNVLYQLQNSFRQPAFIFNIFLLYGLICDILSSLTVFKFGWNTYFITFKEILLWLDGHSVLCYSFPIHIMFLTWFPSSFTDAWFNETSFESTVLTFVLSQYVTF